MRFQQFLETSRMEYMDKALDYYREYWANPSEKTGKYCDIGNYYVSLADRIGEWIEE